MTVTLINELSAGWLAMLWKASWQGGAALLLILALSRALRRIPADVQCWLWRLAYLKSTTRLEAKMGATDSDQRESSVRAGTNMISQETLSLASKRVVV